MEGARTSVVRAIVFSKKRSIADASEKPRHNRFLRQRQLPLICHLIEGGLRRHPRALIMTLPSSVWWTPGENGAAAASRTQNTMVVLTHHTGKFGRNA